MIITWVSFDSTSNSIVEYGTDKLNNSVNGSFNLFVDGGSEKRKLYIHRVTLKNLKQNQKYSKLITFLYQATIENFKKYIL